MLSLSAPAHIIYLKPFSRPAFNQTSKLEVVCLRPLCSECQKEFRSRNNLLHSFPLCSTKTLVSTEIYGTDPSVCLKPLNIPITDVGHQRNRKYTDMEHMRAPAMQGFCRLTPLGGYEIHSSSVCCALESSRITSDRKSKRQVVKSHRATGAGYY